MDIVVWLRSLGLGKYEAAFRENDIDETVLVDLTEVHLRELGIARRTARGQALAYVYNVDEPGRRTAMKRLMRHEALEVAAGDGTYGTIVKLLILTGERRSEITRWRCL